MSSRACKYECGTLIQWDNAKSIFIEQDGTSHTKERCGSLKEKKAKTLSPVFQNSGNPIGSKDDGIKDIAAAIRELAAAIRSRPV